MAEHTMTVEVASSPEEVFCHVADLTRLPDWDSSVRDARLVCDTGPALGRRYAVTIGFYGRALDAEYEITGYERDRRIEWSISGRVDGTTKIDLTPSAKGTRIDYRTEVKMRGLARLLDRGLKAALEGIGANIASALERRFA